MRITRNTQEKLSNILKTQDYRIRYEKGNFAGGYCWVQDQKIIIINKFHPLESKIATLSEIIAQVDFDEEQLSEDQVKVVNTLKASYEAKQEQQQNE